MLDLIWLDSGESVIVDRLTKEAATALLHAESWVELEPPTNISAKVYHLHNGQVLFAWEEASTWVLSSREVHDRLEEERKHGPIAREMLFGLNSLGEQFPNHVTELIHELSTYLGVEINGNFEEVIRQVEVSIAGRSDYLVVQRRYLLHSIALIGEAMIQKHGGYWTTWLARDGVTWNPAVVIYGNMINFWIDLGEEIEMSHESTEPLLETVYQRYMERIRRGTSTTTGSH